MLPGNVSRAQKTRSVLIHATIPPDATLEHPGLSWPQFRTRLPLNRHPAMRGLPTKEFWDLRIRSRLKRAGGAGAGIYSDRVCAGTDSDPLSRWAGGCYRRGCYGFGPGSITFGNRPAFASSGGRLAGLCGIRRCRPLGLLPRLLASAAPRCGVAVLGSMVHPFQYR